ECELVVPGAAVYGDVGGGRAQVEVDGFAGPGELRGGERQRVRAGRREDRNVVRAVGAVDRNRPGQLSHRNGDRVAPGSAVHCHRAGSPGHADGVVAGAAQQQPVDGVRVEDRVVAGSGVEDAVFDACEVDSLTVLRVAGEPPLDVSRRLVQR